MKSARYTHEFVEFLPDVLRTGVLYVSMPYATAVHLCMCGCGYQVTNPLSPEQWNLIFDGRHVSLTPSVGNWSFECESHYWLKGGIVELSSALSRKRIAVGREETRRRIDQSVSDRSRRHQSPADKTTWLRRIIFKISRHF